MHLLGAGTASSGDQSLFPAKPVAVSSLNNRIYPVYDSRPSANVTEQAARRMGTCPRMHAVVDRFLYPRLPEWMQQRNR